LDDRQRRYLAMIPMKKEAGSPDRCGLCAAHLPINPKTGQRFILSAAIECNRCGAPTTPDSERSRSATDDVGGSP